MKKRWKSVLAAVLATTVTVTGTDMQQYAKASETTQKQENETVGAEASQVDETQAPPLLITEVVTDQPSGKRYTYTEVYNNSDTAINFTKDYKLFYMHENETYLEFGSPKYSFGNGDKDVIIEPGKCLVLWQSDGKAGKTVKEFNDFYGTDLVENQDILRLNYSGIHASEKRGYFIGKDRDSILVKAWSNEHGDEIEAGNPKKQGIQYQYTGEGRECQKMEVSKATPGTVSKEQIPETKVHMEEKTLSVENVKVTGTDSLTVTAEIPYKGTSKAFVANLCYRQKKGEFQQEYEDFNQIEMTSTGDGKTFSATIPAEYLFGDQVEWYIKASYGPENYVETEKQVTTVTPSAKTDASAAPLIITEVAASALAEEKKGGPFTYFEVYNQSNQPVNLAYYDIFYYYDYPAKTAAASGKIWGISDFTAYVQPGETMVLWLTNNGSTVEQFNAYYGTDLVEGKDIVTVEYSGFHGTKPRWIRLGTSESEAFTTVELNTSPDKLTGKGKAMQYACPHGEDEKNAGIPVGVSEATPGKVEDWQILSEQVEFCGYKNYPADDGKASTLEICKSQGMDVPETIDEGKDLQVMYETDLLMGATGQERVDAFTDYIDEDNPCNYPGGAQRLKTKPYIIGYEILYKLDDDKTWTSICSQKQYILGHYLLNIPADVLYGHDKVTFKLRAYTLYRATETEESVVKINRLKNNTDSVRLNVKDGDLVSGIATFTATDGEDNHSTEISIDGEKQKTKRMLENGAWFMVKTSGMDSYFKNAITAPYGEEDRDILYIMNAWHDTKDSSRTVHVDNKYFKYNEEKDTYDVDLTIWAGGTSTPFEEIYESVLDANHEDYTVSGLQLRLADGSSYLPTKITPDNAKTNTSTELDVWHTIGDSAGMEPHLTASFSIPASAVDAVGTVVDTSRMPDGSYTVTGSVSGAAVSENAIKAKKTATAEVIVDNTAPSITLPVEEGVCHEPFILEEGAIAQDANGVAEVVASLDDTLVTFPMEVVPRELAVGNHTLKVTAVDKAGNVTEKEVTFTTEQVDPEVTDSKEEAVKTVSADLTVNVATGSANVATGSADVAFYEGAQLTEENGGIQVGEVITDGKGNAPYQLFTVDATKVKEQDTISINWTGQAEKNTEKKPLTMFVLTKDNKWKVLGKAMEDGTIHATLSAEQYTVDGKIILLVQQVTEECRPSLSAKKAKTAILSKSKQDDVNVTVASAGALTQWDGTQRPSQYDFCFAWQTDTQYYVESFPYHYENMNQWIVDNAEDWKIRYVLHTGDIVDDQEMTAEWKNADKAMKIFDDADMPYGVLGGNHDVFGGSGKYDNYWKYFGEKRFADKDYYGGSYKNNLGHYDLLSENGQDFIILYMSWDIYTDEINWMNKVLEKYSDRKAIIALHHYCNVKYTNDTILDYTGELLQSEVVAKNPNVIAVLNGHYHGSSFETAAFDDDGDGVKERTVYQVCTDYQSDPEGGMQYIKFLYFDLANQKIYVNSYSPYENDFNYYDNPKLADYGPGNSALNQDIAEFEFNSTVDTYPLYTKGISVDVRTDKKIGECKQVTGKATYTWTNLKENTTYSWYAKITNSLGGERCTDVKTFTTAKNANSSQTPTVPDSLGGNGGGGGYVPQNTPQISASELPTGTTTPTSTMEAVTTNVPQTLEPAEQTELPRETEETHSSEMPVQTPVVSLKPNVTPTSVASLKPTVTPATSTKQNETTNPIATNVPSASSNEIAGPVNPEVPSVPVNSGENENITGKIYIKSGVKYKVRKADRESKTVQVIGVKDLKKSLVTIPSTVKITGTAYKVTSVASKAFGGSKSLKKVKITSKYLTTIGKEAFAKCEALKSVTISSGRLTTIGTKAFYGDSKLTTITMQSKKLTAKKIGKKAFDGISAKCVIKVPEKNKSVYEKLFMKKGAKATIKVQKVK